MRIRTAAAASLAVAFTLAAASTASAQFYQQQNLVSDSLLNVPAAVEDPNLRNAWGLAASSSSPWWVADNGTDKSTLYNGNTGAKLALVVSVPHAPTGVVFNSTTGFAPFRFIFSTEEGKILAWSAGTVAAIVKADNSASGAVYKGLAISAAGPYLYATNFHAGTVDVFDKNFDQTTVPGGFSDPTIPAGYAPFGIQNIGETIYVTYALRGPDGDDVPGEGHGYVNAFDTGGNLRARVASQGPLNSPWGLALAPRSDFGKFSGDLLVGNFGDGRIHAYDPADAYELRGPLHSTQGRPIEIDGLWALQFGNGAAAGPKNTLFFTAGPFEEAHGLFGRLDVAGPPGKSR